MTSTNPFARADSWRAHPQLNKPWPPALPGFFLGAGAFAAYVAVDKARARAKGGSDKGAH